MGMTMNYALGFFLFVLCSSLTVTAQVLPTVSGSCGVSPSGLMSCDWLSAVPRTKADGSTRKQSDPAGRPELIVTRFNLSPGAPLTRMVTGEDELIIGMGKGELINEAKSPPLHISVSEGSVFLMPKEGPYALRNVGKQEADVLVVRIHPMGVASQ
jgi:hypothetical protein